MRTLALLSEKGGTGKTTSALNIAAGLAAAGERVLVIDTDPQANATLVLTQRAVIETPTISHVLLGEATLQQAALATHWPGVDLVPADSTLAEVNIQLTAMLGPHGRLRRALAGVCNAYTMVVVDASPQRTLVNWNVLNAVDELIVPIDPSLFSEHGLTQLADSVEEVREHLDNAELRIGGLLLTRVRKDNVARSVEEKLRAQYPGLVYTAAVPHNVKVEEAHSRFESVLSYAPRSPGAKAYAAVVEEIRHGIAAQNGHGDASADAQAVSEEPGAEAAAPRRAA